MDAREFGMAQLASILKTHSPKKVLDLGCGSGQQSILSASYGAHVDAVDKGEWPDPRRQFRDYLIDHPNIFYKKSDLLEYEIQGKYDLVLLQRVINFLPKEFVLQKLFPSITKSLNGGGVVYVVLLESDDNLMRQGEQFSYYSVDEIQQGLGISIAEAIEKKLDLPPASPEYGKRFVHQSFLTFKKD